MPPLVYTAAMRGALPITPERARHLYLTGFMGSGKTVVGKVLAERLGVRFLDLDHELELRREMSVSDIWLHHGEAMFRRWENELFAHFAFEPLPFVLATGGGTLIDPTNFDIAHRTGVTIYLIVDFHTAMLRVQQDPHRPLIKDGDPLEGAERLRKLFHKRLPYYRMADIHVDAVHGSIGEVADRICAILPAEVCKF